MSRERDVKCQEQGMPRERDVKGKSGSRETGVNRKWCPKRLSGERREKMLRERDAYGLWAYGLSFSSIGVLPFGNFCHLACPGSTDFVAGSWDSKMPLWDRLAADFILPRSA